MRIHPGTSGWSYPAWRGRFYPEHLAPAGFLAAYAARLPSVEVNATFYRMPTARTLAGWRAEVPAAFTFAVKAPRRITHARRLAGVEETVGHLLRTAAELGDALGPILFQLPPTMKKDLPRLRDALALLPRGGRAAFDLRHPSWHDEETRGVLAGAGAALCVEDREEGTTPLAATATFGYLRLRRPDYDEVALGRWLDTIRAQPWTDAWVFLKHEDEARGPKLALALAALAGTGGGG